MKPNKMKRHLQTQHPDHSGKSREYYERKLSSLEKQRSSMDIFVATNELLVKASCVTAFHIGQKMKSHSIGEELILPVMKDVVEIVCGKSEAAKLDKIPLSNSTMQRRIEDVADDMLAQLLERVKSSPFFAIQLDESTDIEGKAQLLVYIRYLKSGKLEENFLFCETLDGRVDGESLFGCLDNFMSSHQIPWSSCVGVCTDGAAACTGRRSGVATRIREVAPHAIWTHCFIHREALVAKEMSSDLHEVLSDCITMVNFIKGRPLNQRLFARLCREMESKHTSLLFHSAVRWLSCGRVLNRVYELRDEIRIFLEECEHSLAKKVIDVQWIAKLAYLCEIFERLNQLNLALQGPEKTVIDSSSVINAFFRKIDLWIQMVTQGRLEHFSLLDAFIEQVGASKDAIVPVIVEHLDNLKGRFLEYFGEIIGKAVVPDWVIYPFNYNVTFDDHFALQPDVLEVLLDVSSDMALKALFPSVSVTDFWFRVQFKFPKVASMALKWLVPFVSTWSCEAGFSALTTIKTKRRNRLQAANDMRLALTKNIEPRFDKICKEMQLHPSH